MQTIQTNQTIQTMQSADNADNSENENNTDNADNTVNAHTAAGVYILRYFGIIIPISETKYKAFQKTCQLAYIGFNAFFSSK